MKNKLALILILGMSACAPKENAKLDSNDDLSTSVESGVTVISAMGDEQTSASFADNRKTFENYALRAKNLILPEAWAASCGRAAQNACASGVKSESYDACQLPYSTRSMNGQVTLTYTNASCALTSAGDSVERTYDLTISGPYGGALNISSAAHADYRGESYGGGGSLTRTAAGWDIEVMGKRQTLARGSKTIFDIQTRTLSPLHVTGSLSRASRIVDGGQLEVVHNRAKFTAVYSANNLTWTAQCCHPVSGSMDISYSGSVSGSGKVTFNGCGTATLEKEGLSREINLNYCE